LLGLRKEIREKRQIPLMLALRNTLTRQVEPVAPLQGGTVRMYSCGPTVYRFAHIGNLRTFLLADFIRRVLLYHGLNVIHVQNITDVGHMRDERFDRGEDRMLVAAGLENRTPSEIADAYEAAFHTDEALVNILPANVFPRATEHIGEMIDIAERLVDTGHAYLSESGNVYYDVSSFPEYGRLSGNTLADLRAGHRGDVEPDKRDPADFALWKAAGEGRLLKWATPLWGDGFPGWHLECSAMALRWLGERFDIHTGGIDNVFPHHEDEIAQSAPLVGGPPATHWVHGEHLLMRGRKMAKSAGNFERITDLADDGIDPLAFRYLTLTSRYGRKLNYSEESLSAAAAALSSLRDRVRGMGSAPSDGPWTAPQPLRGATAPDRPLGLIEGPLGHGAEGSIVPELTDRARAPIARLSDEGADLHRRFVEAIDADLDLPAALAVVREIARSGLPDDERRWLVLDADFVLGLDLDQVWSSTPAASDGEDLRPELAALLDERSAARRARDFARADSLRDELRANGVEVIDEPGGGTSWRRVARG
jgi:cysteinyl-tRNA synthetase